jgi:hypothetical protein
MISEEVLKKYSTNDVPPHDLHPGALSVFYPPNQYKNRIDYPPP